MYVTKDLILLNRMERNLNPALKIYGSVKKKKKSLKHM